MPVRSLFAFLTHQKRGKVQMMCCILYIPCACDLHISLWFLCFQNIHWWVWQLWCGGGYPGADPDQRSFYFWAQTGYREHIMPTTEQDTCNRPLTVGHFESLSPSLRAGANPCCVYHTTGTTAGWSVSSLSWTSWSADTYGYYLGWCALIWISTNGLQGGISASTVSYVHLGRYKGLSPAGRSKSSHCYWQISLLQWKIVLVRD